MWTLLPVSKIKPMKIKLPSKKELKGQRFGQLIFNVLGGNKYRDGYLLSKKNNKKIDNEIIDELFFVENKDLKREINNYLKRSHK